MTKKTAILYSPSSGNNGVTLSDILETFESYGQTPVVLEIDKEIKRLTKKVQGEKAQLIVAVGGDGTVNVAANVAVGAGIPMAVLPLGTINNFAKDVGVPLKLNEAVRLIFEENQEAIDYCTVNGHVFVNSSCIGMYPAAVEGRSKLEPKLGKRIAKLITAVVIGKRARPIKLDFEIGDKKRTLKTTLVFVGNNSYKFEQLGFTNRDDLTGGRLFIYVVRANRLTALIRLVVYAFFGKRHKKHDFLQVTDETLTIKARADTLEVSVDGEVKTLRTPLVYEIHPHGLRVCLPKPSRSK